MILELRTRLNSWFIWQYNCGSSLDAVVMIAKSKNGDVRASDETVAVSGIKTKGKNAAFFRNEKRSCSAWLKVTSRCWISERCPCSGFESSFNRWRALFSEKSSSSKNSLWRWCKAATSSLTSGVETVGRWIENPEPPEGEEWLFFWAKKGRLRGLIWATMWVWDFDGYLTSHGISSGALLTWQYTRCRSAHIFDISLVDFCIRNGF